MRRLAVLFLALVVVVVAPTAAFALKSTPTAGPCKVAPKGKRTVCPNGDLARRDLTGANLAGANLVRANLTRAKLGGANITNTIFSKTICPNGKAADYCAVPFT